MQIEEKDLKVLLKRGDFPKRCLLTGDDSFLVLSYRKKLMDFYDKHGFGIEVYESASTDFKALLESSQMISLMGEKRAIFIDDFETSLVNPSDWDNFLSFCTDDETGDSLVITAGDSFDIKKKARDKKLHSLFGSRQMCVNLLKHTASMLRDEIRTICKRQNCEISGETAFYMVDMCGDDLELLKNECKKLCSYVQGEREITKADVDLVCTKRQEANLYELASLLLKGDMRSVLEKINILISQKVAVLQIVSSLTTAFYSLYAASVAKGKGKKPDSAAADLKMRFAWKMKNYYRDCASFPQQNLFKALEIMCRAEQDLKSKSMEDRVVLETACLRIIEALGERN